jgi:hypothetical protein
MKYNQRSTDFQKKGESVFELYCEKNNIQYKKASFFNDKFKGVDYWFKFKEQNSFEPVDVKYTPDIYLLNYRISMKKYITRHPFRDSTISKYYFYNNLGIIEINKHLEKYIKDIDGLRNYLYSINYMPGCHIKDNNKFAKTLEQSLYIVKLKLSTYLKDNCKIVYAKEDGDYFFKITKI